MVSKDVTESSAIAGPLILRNARLAFRRICGLVYSIDVAASAQVLRGKKRRSGRQGARVQARTSCLFSLGSYSTI